MSQNWTVFRTHDDMSRILGNVPRIVYEKDRKTKKYMLERHFPNMGYHRNDKNVPINVDILWKETSLTSMGTNGLTI